MPEKKTSTRPVRSSRPAAPARKKPAASDSKRPAAAKKGSTQSSSPSKAKASKSGVKKRWSAKVTKESDALDLQPDLFKQQDPKAIASSLKQSAEASHRRKGSPLQSAMSMLNFYINRAGKNLAAAERKVLARAKTELHALFDKGRKGGRSAR